LQAVAAELNRFLSKRRLKAQHNHAIIAVGKRELLNLERFGGVQRSRRRLLLRSKHKKEKTMGNTELKGSCLCGRVKYSISTELQTFYFCHCEQCRKITGSAFASNILAKPAEIQWLSGGENINRFDYPGDRSFTKVFCKVCGSGLPFHNESGTHIFIPAGSLDGDPNIRPEKNIFWGDKSTWYEAGIQAPKCDGFPE
jgi:hypothetical protein